MKFEDDLSFDSSENLEVDILPLIDVIFTILAFVILAAISMTTVSRLDVALPAAKRSQPTSEPHRVSITITKMGAISINAASVPQDQVQPILMQQLQASGAHEVLINADRDAKLGIVVKVLDIVKQWPLVRVAINTVNR
ncbi:biopolymer transporter ExbD [Synechococcus sp. FGCU-3]|nr:biopolymer transporter ExbD [Synechococcus sp. FGCU3]